MPEWTAAPVTLANSTARRLRLTAYTGNRAYQHTFALEWAGVCPNWAQTQVSGDYLTANVLENMTIGESRSA